MNKKIVFLCSGGGGNLRFIHKMIEVNCLKSSEIVAVLTDRGCPVNDYCQAHKIPNECIDFSDPEQPELIHLLSKYNPDLIITTVHKIISPTVVSQYNKKLINLHYSLLPAFGGLIGASPLKKAISSGVKFTGVTVHFVDNILDGGEPIIQTVIPLKSTTPFEDLMEITFRCGCVSLLSAISYLLFEKKINIPVDEQVSIVNDHLCLFSHSIDIFLDEWDINDSHFWNDIKIF
jgi:phosphoribosylglycinamide formyltransferase-1